MTAKILAALVGVADLWGASLRGADLTRVKLHNATLPLAFLQGTILTATEFDENTALPDSNQWTPDTDMNRFTNPYHPNFWQPGSPTGATMSKRDSLMKNTLFYGDNLVILGKLH